MNHGLFNRPVWLFALSIVASGILLATGWRLRNENAALAAESTLNHRTSDAPATVRIASVGALPAGMEEGESLQKRIAELRKELQNVVAAREQSEARIAELKSSLPDTEGDVVVSFGALEAMGRQSGKLVRMMIGEVGRNLIAGKELSPEEQQAAQQAFVLHMRQVSELRRIEDVPREISQYQTGALRELYALDSEGAMRVSSFLEAEFERLHGIGLTASHRPVPEPKEWDDRRDAEIIGIASRMRSLLPANHPHLDMLPGVLNLGAGFRTQVTINPDGHGNVQMYLPLFPSKIAL